MESPPKHLLSPISHLLSPICILCLVVLDQASKYLVRARFSLHESLSVVRGLFNLTYVQNRGAAWGILSGWRYAFVVLAVAMLAAMGRYRSKVFGDGPVGRASFILLFAGIVGNLIDRAALGYVVDFLDFHWGVHHFPAFNVADSCICVGVGLYALASFAGNGERGTGNGG